MEALRLRVRDLDFERRELTVRDGSGCECSYGRCDAYTRKTLLRGTEVCNYPERSAVSTGMQTSS